MVFWMHTDRCSKGLHSRSAPLAAAWLVVHPGGAATGRRLHHPHRQKMRWRLRQESNMRHPDRESRTLSFPYSSKMDNIMKIHIKNFYRFRCPTFYPILDAKSHIDIHKREFCPKNLYPTINQGAPSVSGRSVLSALFFQRGKPAVGWPQNNPFSRGRPNCRNEKNPSREPLGMPRGDRTGFL